MVHNVSYKGFQNPATEEEYNDRLEFIEDRLRSLMKYIVMEEYNISLTHLAAQTYRNHNSLYQWFSGKTKQIGFRTFMAYSLILPESARIKIANAINTYLEVGCSPSAIVRLPNGVMLNFRELSKREKAELAQKALLRTLNIEVDDWTVTLDFATIDLSKLPRSNLKMLLLGATDSIEDSQENLSMFTDKYNDGDRDGDAVDVEIVDELKFIDGEKADREKVDGEKADREKAKNEALERKAAKNAKTQADQTTVVSRKRRKSSAGSSISDTESPAKKELRFNGRKVQRLKS